LLTLVYPDFRTGHAGAAGVLHALHKRANLGGSYVVQCALLVANMQMLSYGTYTEDQQDALKKRNPELVGHMRHYDEIVSHGRNRHCVRGFIADRPFEKAIKPEYFQEIDGSPWGLGPVSVAKFALKLSKTETSFPIGAAPPGYHLPQWTLERNPSFEPVVSQV